ncbi:YybH family protein [Nocardia sp. NPDC127579]|uniref:YybH family protein n=1 Tax=Nocardia sp. NPDC127579 TaxID=3345402 RepID=UPI0036340D6F
MNDIAIRTVIDDLVAGLRAKDLAAVERAYSPDVISFDVEPPLQHVGIAAKLENWKRAFAFFETIDYEVRNLALTVGADIAFGHGFGRLSGTLADGTPTTGMWVRVTYGLRLTDDTWRIVHDQVSVPLDMATGRPVTDLEP